MANSNLSANPSIKCSVQQCTYNSDNSSNNGYCTLNTVMIGTHEPNPTETKCVDCESFVVGNTSSY